jgi:hypothetical protein
MLLEVRYWGKYTDPGKMKYQRTAENDTMKIFII